LALDCFIASVIELLVISAVVSLFSSGMSCASKVVPPPGIFADAQSDHQFVSRSHEELLPSQGWGCRSGVRRRRDPLVSDDNLCPGIAPVCKAGRCSLPLPSTSRSVVVVVSSAAVAVSPGMVAPSIAPDVARVKKDRRPITQTRRPVSLVSSTVTVVAQVEHGRRPITPPRAKICIDISPEDLHRSAILPGFIVIKLNLLDCHSRVISCSIPNSARLNLLLDAYYRQYGFLFLQSYLFVQGSTVAPSDTAVSLRLDDGASIHVFTVPIVDRARTTG